MAKTAAALHILVKEEKLALDLLEQLKNGADFVCVGMYDFQLVENTNLFLDVWAKRDEGRTRVWRA